MVLTLSYYQTYLDCTNENNNEKENNVENENINCSTSQSIHFNNANQCTYSPLNQVHSLSNMQFRFKRAVCMKLLAV